MKVLSLFSGIGAFEKALKNLEVPVELVGYCEIDKCASRSYAAIHGVSEEKNLLDVTKIDTSKLPKNIDLITYGFPCQDISLAGKQRGFHNKDGSLTRSGLFFEALRIIEDTKPKIAIAENVKNLTSKKFSEQFNIVLDSLEQAGYNNYWKVLNARDYGVPQNRERVFIVSIRKDIDRDLFEFPKPFPLEKRLKDVLEDEPINTMPDGTCRTIKNQYYKTSAANFQRTSTFGATGAKDIHSMRFRKLTPKECFRLMGFSDEDFRKAAQLNSNTQLYKQAGNSIVVDVLEELFLHDA